VMGAKQLGSVSVCAFLLCACNGSDSAGAPPSGDAGAVGSGGSGGIIGAAGAGGAVSTGGRGSVIHGGPPCNTPSAPNIGDVVTKELVYPAQRGSPVRELALAKNALYFSVSPNIYRLAIGQTTAAVVTQIPVASRALGFHFNDTDLFFNSGDTILRAPLDGTSVTAVTVFSGVAFATQAVEAADGQNLYLFDSQTSTISAAAIAGGSPTAVATDATAGACKLAGGDLFYIRTGVSGDEIARVPISGGAAQTVLTAPTAPSLHGIEVTASDVFAAAGGGVYRAALGGPTAGLRIMGEAPSISLGVDEVTFVGSQLYWSSDSEVFGWVAPDGTSCRAVVDVQAPFNGAVVSGTDMYVSSDDGIYKIPVP
jgi:hypothetical protein